MSLPIIRSRLNFQPSPDVRSISWDKLSIGRNKSIDEVGDAGYIVKIIVDGQSRPDQKLMPWVHVVEIDAPEGSFVQIFIYPVDEEGTTGLAREYRFRVKRKKPPLPVGEIQLCSTEVKSLSLPVLSP